MFEPNHIYKIAKQRRDAGRLPQAEELLVGLLNQAPDHLDSACLLAEIALERGRWERALELLSRIAEVAPDRAEVFEMLGRAHLGMGRADDAWTCLTRAEALMPGSGEIQKSLCAAALHKNDLEEARFRGEAAVRLSPRDAGAHAILGDVYLDRGRPEAALSSYGRSLGLNPDNWRILLRGAEAYLLLGKAERAEQSLALANLLDPGNPSILLVLCSHWIELGRFEDASKLTKQLSAALPEHPKVRLLEGLIALRRGRPRHAVGCLAKALAEDEADSQAAALLAEALRRDGKTEQAAKLLGRVIKNAPDAPALRASRIKALLAEGKTQNAAEELERLRQRASLSVPLQGEPWRGEDLRGKTLLLYSLLGAEELLLFLGFARRLEEIGARVAVQCVEPLRALVESAKGVHAVFTRADDDPEVDYHAPFELLPDLLGTPLDSPPEPAGLRIDDALEASFAKKLPKTNAVAVGIMWRRETDILPDAYDSVPLSALAPLFEIEKIDWISLQTEAGIEELESSPHQNRVHRLGLEDAALPERLAALKSLDLLITADTLTAQLATAAGLPAWVLVSTAPRWHWGKEGPGSRRHPSARLFRQKEIGDWDQVVAAVAEALEERLESHGSPEMSGA